MHPLVNGSVMQKEESELSGTVTISRGAHPHSVTLLEPTVLESTFSLSYFSLPLLLSQP